MYKTLFDVSRATDRAKQKYPNGYSKHQLIECAKEVQFELYGNRAGLPVLGYIPIKTELDIAFQRNVMIRGNYPASMSDCEVVGINGDCGSNCPVLLAGKCECIDDV